MTKKLTLMLFAFPFVLISCSPESAWLIHWAPKKHEFEARFDVSRSEMTSQQKKYDENQISVYFKVDNEGKSVGGLKESDLQVFENGIAVDPFVLAHETKRTNKVADIMFLVDVTGTMVELIETAKKRLDEFVKSSRARGYHTRMCISTFGDYTVKKCSRFFDNNPDDPSTEVQIKELRAELARLHAYRGEGKDPGWPDLDENPMGALIDAAQAPWGEDSQRFVILVTDWGFLYSPDNQGTIGDKAPTMAQVHEAIRASQMKVFAVTRTEHTHKGQHLVWDGYNTPFQGEPGIVQASGGEHFNFDQVLKGQISLTSILERILQRLDTTYKLTYIVDKSPALDPSLPLDQRKIEIRLRDTQSGQVYQDSVLSTMPMGRPHSLRRWPVANSAVIPSSLKVLLDEKEVSPEDYTVQGNEVIFKEAPRSGAHIRVSFLHADHKLNLWTTPLHFTGVQERDVITVFLNEHQAKPSDFAVAKDLEGQTSISITDAALRAEDPYEIFKNQGVTMKIQITKPGYTEPWDRAQERFKREKEEAAKKE